MDRHLLQTKSSKPVSASTLVFAGVVTAVVISSGHPSGLTQFLQNAATRIEPPNFWVFGATSLYMGLVLGLCTACARWFPRTAQEPPIASAQPRTKAPVALLAAIAALCFTIGYSISVRNAATPRMQQRGERPNIRVPTGRNWVEQEPCRNFGKSPGQAQFSLV